MRAKQFKSREFRSVLSKNGYRLSRYKGSHTIWTNASNDTIIVPATYVNCMLARRLIKEHKLVV